MLGLDEIRGKPATDPRVNTSSSAGNYSFYLLRILLSYHQFSRRKGSADQSIIRLIIEMIAVVPTNAINHTRNPVYRFPMPGIVGYINAALTTERENIFIDFLCCTGPVRICAMAEGTDHRQRHNDHHLSTSA